MKKPTTAAIDEAPLVAELPDEAPLVAELPDEAPLVAEIETPREITLAGALVTLEIEARQILALIAVEPARRQTTHQDHADMSAIELRASELLSVLARRKI